MEMPSLKRCVSHSSSGGQRSKAMRSNSDDIVIRKSGSPRILLFLDDGSCVLYNTKAREIERKLLTDMPGSRFVANSGKWFLMLDSGFNLSIVDVLGEDTRIDLPPLDSLLPRNYTLKRLVDKEEYHFGLPSGAYDVEKADTLRGRLWVDDKTGDFSVVWFFDHRTYLMYCKKGDTHYIVVPVRDGVPKVLCGLIDLVVRGHRLYIASRRRYIRVVDLSGPEGGFEDVTESYPKPMVSYLGDHSSFSIAVRASGEVLLVESTTFENQRSFLLYKKDPTHVDPYSYDPKLIEVDDLGDEALLLDLGITVPANHTLGIKPNCIYFTRHDPARLYLLPFDLDICVFNCATKTIKRFPQLANMNISLKDAQWFHPIA